MCLLRVYVDVNNACISTWQFTFYVGGMEEVRLLSLAGGLSSLRKRLYVRALIAGDISVKCVGHFYSFNFVVRIISACALQEKLTSTEMENKRRNRNLSWKCSKYFNSVLIMLTILILFNNNFSKRQLRFLYVFAPLVFDID